MDTPSTTIVRTSIDGKNLEIDFLHGILGISQKELLRGVSVIEVAILKIMLAFQNDERIDRRYHGSQRKSMIKRIEGRCARRPVRIQF
jgi:hypothetical protein